MIEERAIVGLICLYASSQGALVSNGYNNNKKTQRENPHISARLTSSVLRKVQLPVGNANKADVAVVVVIVVGFASFGSFNTTITSQSNHVYSVLPVR